MGKGYSRAHQSSGDGHALLCPSYAGVIFNYAFLLMKIKAVIHPAEEGGYWAEVPALPGCITEGDTIHEVMVNLKDAIEGWLDVANARKSVH
jgi:predicted RNase H-like HicB family nuclease